MPQSKARDGYDLPVVPPIIGEPGGFPFSARNVGQSGPVYSQHFRWSLPGVFQHLSKRKAFSLGLSSLPYPWYAYSFRSSL